MHVDLLRLASELVVSGYPPEVRKIFQAMKTYGMILADNGSDWYISGAPSPGWDNDQLHQLGHRVLQVFDLFLHAVDSACSSPRGISMPVHGSIYGQKMQVSPEISGT